jgi:hypothetical protein
MIAFHISDTAKAHEPEIRYTLGLWAINQAHSIQFSQRREGAVSIGTSSDDQLRIAPNFSGPGMASRTSPFIRLDGGPADVFYPASIDLLASAFQMVNALQEYGTPEADELNRYQYKSSYQNRLGGAGDNLVQQCFNAINKVVSAPLKSAPTRFFLSHDIDIVYNAIVEDGYHVIRKGRFDLFLKMLFNLAIGRPEWLNMDKIMALESAQDCKSIFFWIVNKGRINRREENADYRFHSRPIQRQYAHVSSQGFENGLHKSLSRDSFREEFTKYGNVPYANRYHFLKFRLPDAWHDIESAGLALDASLGFSAEMGFRNSYGLPFNPYNFVKRQSFSFVEAPLHIMDRTFFQYKKQSPEKAGIAIVDFFEKNKTNAVLSILWHNNFFTDYKFKGYLALYKRILTYISDNNFRTISAREVVQQYATCP